MKDFDINPAWRTSTVLELCRSMREAQDFSAIPILADALQDAGCDNDELLARMRGAPLGYALDAATVARVLSDEAAESARWLENFADAHDCPHFEELFNAATDNHHLNDLGDGYQYSKIADWGEQYLHFNGSDAHGEIPPEFWEHVERVSGKAITDRPSGFSCSC